MQCNNAFYVLKNLFLIMHIMDSWQYKFFSLFDFIYAAKGFTVYFYIYKSCIFMSHTMTHGIIYTNKFGIVTPAGNS